jgi:hypothetical protein
MKIKIILLLLALCVAAGANAQNNEDNLVDRVSRAVGVRLPDGYEAKVKEFAAKSELLKRKSAEAFTEQWIAEQMKTSWGIDRGNQLLFVWDAVYEQITKKNFYDGEDGNKKRLDEFEKVMDNVEACGKKFKEDFTAYMKQRSAEAERRSAEAERRSAEAEKRSAEYKRQSAEAEQRSINSTHNGLNQCIRFYKLYKKNPSLIKPNDVVDMKEYAKHVTQNCKEYNIDYKAELRKELGDDKKVAELLKFYGVE